MRTRTMASLGALALGMTLSTAFAADPARPPITVRKVPVEGTPVEGPRTDASSVDESRSTRSSELMGTELVIENGESLGKVADLIIDNRSGSVSHVVVETDQEYRAVPWKTLALYQGEDPADRYFIIGMERPQFMEVPAITHQEYQTYTYPQWQQYLPGTVKFYTNVRPAQPAAVRQANRQLNQADRKADRQLNQADRKVDREINEAERKLDRKID